jgi:hypothetical protein
MPLTLLAMKAISRARFEEEEREVMRFIEAAIDWSDLGPTPSHTAQPPFSS